MGNLVTGKVRFSYANVFEPRQTPNGDQKYSVTLLIPKSYNNTYQRIMAEINKSLQENLSTKFNGVMPANPKLPIHDGDGVRQSGEEYGPECKGHWVITANSNNAPEIVDASGNPIISKNELKKVRYGLVYKDTKKYLDYDYLKNIILSMQNDKTFLKKLVSNYRNSYSCVIEISEIKNYLFYSNSEVDIYLTLNNFFLNEILKKDLKTGEFKIKYKSLHDLAMFVRNYMEKMSLGVTENFENINLKKRLLLLEKSKLTNGVDTKLTPKTKKLTRKKLSKQPLEGQISLFD